MVSIGATLGSFSQAAEVPVIQSMADKWSEKAGLPIRISNQFQMFNPGQLAISPGNFLAVMPNIGMSIIIWDLKTGQPFRVRDNSLISAIAFSPISDTLAFSAGNYIKILDVQRKKITKRWKGHKKDIISLAFSPDGKLLASGSDTIKIWNAQSGTLTKKMPANEIILSLAFSFDDQEIASGSRDSSLKLWDLKTEQLKKSFPGFTSSIISIKFSPAGQIVATSAATHPIIQLWDLEKEKLTEKLIKTMEGESVAFSPDGTLLAISHQLITVHPAAEESFITLRDMQTFEKIRIIKIESRARSLAFTQDGMQLAAVIPESNKIVVLKLGN